MNKQIIRFFDFISKNEEKSYNETVLESEGISEENNVISLNESTDFINEAAEAKDVMRIQDIIKKAAGNTAKESQLADTMARLITKKDKAMRRYEAAFQVLGKDHNVTNIFAQKAVELGNRVEGVVPGEIKVSTTNVEVASKTMPEFVWNEGEAREAWDLFLSYTAKLRGNNWGDAFETKLSKLPIKTRVYIAIISSMLVNSSYEDRRRNNYWEPWNGGRKFDYAYSGPSREYRIRPLLTQMDFGDAKTNKSNPAHVLFTYENAKEEAARSLEDLRQLAAQKYSEYKRPKYLFEPGEPYKVYASQGSGPGGRGRGIEFNDPWALYFWNHNMIGQMSDGYWENSRKYADDWRYWSGLECTFNPNAKPPSGNSMTDMQNPKLVQQYAIQSDIERLIMGKIMTLNDNKYLSILRNYYKISIPTIENLKSLANAESMAEKLGMELDDLLVFAFAPPASLAEVKKAISNAHTEIANGMKRIAHGTGRYDENE
jgi:hypothetical protein